MAREKLKVPAKDPVKEQIIQETGHAKEMLDKARTPDKYEDVDTFVRLTTLNIDQKKLKNSPDGTEEITSHLAVLKGEYAKGTPEEIIVTIRFTCRKKDDLKNFLKGRLTLDDEFNIKAR